MSLIDVVSEIGDLCKFHFYYCCVFFLYFYAVVVPSLLF